MITMHLDHLKRSMQEKNLDAMYLSSYENYRYFSGFTGSNCHLIITKEQNFLITDGRYTEQAHEQTQNYKIVVKPRPPREVLFSILREISAYNVGYETMKLSDFEVTAMRREAPEINWIPQPEFGVRTREIKDENEIDCIQKAVDIADTALTQLLSWIRPGITEREVAAELEYLMAKNGSERCAFDTIVASGVRGALPHGAPTNKKIMPGEMVTIDFGACFNGYMSDITRTLWMGDVPDHLARIWKIVDEAQKAAVRAVRPGITALDLDAIHRTVFEKQGMQEYIMHSLGHGVGLEIHESPSISRTNKTVLKENMVITIEPGLYLPNIGGVRIEDTVLVTGTGARVLTQSEHMMKIDCN